MYFLLGDISIISPCFQPSNLLLTLYLQEAESRQKEADCAKWYVYVYARGVYVLRVFVLCTGFTLLPLLEPDAQLCICNGKFFGAPGSEGNFIKIGMQQLRVR